MVLLVYLLVSRRTFRRKIAVELTIDLLIGCYLSTHGTIGWCHAFSDLTPGTAMNFAGGSVFTIQGVPLAQDAAAFGAGFDLAVGRNVPLGVSYDASAHDDTVKLNIDWKL